MWRDFLGFIFETFVSLILRTYTLNFMFKRFVQFFINIYRPENLLECFWWKIFPNYTVDFSCFGKNFSKYIIARFILINFSRYSIVSKEFWVEFFYHSHWKFARQLTLFPFFKVRTYLFRVLGYGSFFSP